MLPHGLHAALPGVFEHARSTGRIYLPLVAINGSSPVVNATVGTLRIRNI